MQNPGGGGGQLPSFQTGLQMRLAEVSSFAQLEMEAASTELERLREENRLLKSKLSAPPSTEVDILEMPAFRGEEEPAAGQAGDLSEGWALRRDSCLGSNAEQDRAAATGTTNSFTLPTLARRASNCSQLLLKLPGDGVSQRPSKQRVARRTSQSNHGAGRLLQPIASSAVFENATIIVTMLNALWLGVDLDLNGKVLLDSPIGFQVVEHIFVAVFTLELIVRLGAAERWRQVLTDKWILLDMVLVPLMVIDTWVLTFLFLLTPIDGLQGLGFFSIFRLLRVMRIARAARICRVIPELETMIKSMMAGVRAVLTTAMLLLAATYACAILMRQLGGSSTWGREHFQSVPASIYTLLGQSMLPDNVDMLTIIFKDKWYCGAVYFVFLLFSTIMVVNMLVALLCDVVANTSRTEQKARSVDGMGQRLHDILKSIDDDFDGFVSRAEFEKIIENPEAVQLFSSLGVDVDALVDEADFIFDKRQRTQLSFDDFKEEVLQFRQTSAATMGTITATRRFIRLSLEQVAAKIVHLESSQEALMERAATRALILQHTFGSLPGSTRSEFPPGETASSPLAWRSRSLVAGLAEQQADGGARQTSGGLERAATETPLSRGAQQADSGAQQANRGAHQTCDGPGELPCISAPTCIQPPPARLEECVDRASL